jgi:hypothetical protein
MNPVPTEHDPRPHPIALRVLAGVVLVVAMLGAAGFAMAVGGAEMVATAQEPTETPDDDQPTEQQPPEDAPAPDDTEETEDAPTPDDTEEPASAPGDVPLAVWIGAILFLALAVGLAASQATKKSSSGG